MDSDVASATRSETLIKAEPSKKLPEENSEPCTSKIKTETLEKEIKPDKSSEIQFKSCFKAEDQHSCNELEPVMNLEKCDLNLKDIPEQYKEKYMAYINEVNAIASIPILQSVSEEHIRDFKFFNMRYYEDKYCINFGVMELGFNDTNIRIHTNKLMLVALASGNDIIRNGKPIVDINFVINNSDRSKIRLTGKWKRGSKIVSPSTILCQVKCEGDEKLYNVRAGIRGNLIEINEHIKTNPDLLRTDPKGMGFIAILIPPGKPDQYEEMIKQLNLLTEEEYMYYLLQRPPKYSDSINTKEPGT